MGCPGKCMPCNSSQTNDHSRVLNRTVFIVHPGSDRPHIASLTVSQQFLNAIHIYKLRIVVQKQQIFTGRLLHTEVIDG